MSPQWFEIAALLALILVANGAPPAAALVLGGRGRSLDGGRALADGRPLFGPSKTWRGSVAALGATPLAAQLLGWGWGAGLAVALGAIAGDLLASFVKRRAGLPSSASVPLLDQLPEALIPALLVSWTMGLGWLDLAIAAAAFTALDLLLTPLGRRLARARSPKAGSGGRGR